MNQERFSMDSKLVIVLLSTFNGEKHLAEQIYSILNQSHPNIKIICRDDGSHDATTSVLENFSNSSPDKLILLKDQLGNIGIKRSFSLLLEFAAATFNESNHYFALADQDDIWVTDKISISLSAMMELEKEFIDSPLLVHSDLRVVDDFGTTMSEHMSSYQGLRPQRDQLMSQLLSNTLTGCTALINRTLLKKCIPIPDNCVMHDHWISIVASAFGHRHFIQESLVEYRQHAGNAVGAKAQLVEHQYQAPNRWHHWAHNIRLLLRHTSVAFNRDHQTIFAALSLQAEAFIRRFAAELPPSELAAARSVARLHRYPPVVQRVLFRWLR